MKIFYLTFKTEEIQWTFRFSGFGNLALTYRWLKIHWVVFSSAHYYFQTLNSELTKLAINMFYNNLCYMGCLDKINITELCWRAKSKITNIYINGRPQKTLL